MTHLTGKTGVLLCHRSYIENFCYSTKHMFELGFHFPRTTLDVRLMLNWSCGLGGGERGAALILTSTRRKLPSELGDRCAFTLDNTFFESVPRRRAGGQVLQQGHSWVNTQHCSHQYELWTERRGFVGINSISEPTRKLPTSQYVPAPCVSVSCPEEVQYWSWRPWIQSAVVAS